MKLTDLLEAAAEGLMPALSLDDVVETLAVSAADDGPTNLRKAVERTLRRRVAVQEARSGAALLCRAVTKQVDYVSGDAEMRGVSIEARAEVAERLAQEAALRLAEAAEALVRFGALSGNAAVLKDSARRSRGGDVAQRLSVARQEREACRAEVERALRDAFLVVAFAGGEA